MKTNRQQSNSTPVELIYRLLFSIFLSLLILLISLSQVKAQTISLSISPPVTTLNLKPGETFTQTFRLKNLSQDTTITASLIPFQAADDLGHIAINLNQTSPAAVYFSLQNDDLNLNSPFTLKAGQTKDLILTIQIPDNIPAADHYLTLLIDSNTQGLIAGTGSISQAAIGANILLTIASDTPQPQASIEAFSFNQTDFILKLKNSSTHYLTTIGHLDITNMLGKTTTIPLQETNVLANSSRQILPETLWKPLLAFGRYSATATITPKNSPVSHTQTISFWVWPYKLLVIITLVFISIFVYSQYIKTYQN